MPARDHDEDANDWPGAVKLAHGQPASSQSSALVDNGEPVGRFHAWWRGMALPDLPPLPGLLISSSLDPALAARATGMAESETRRRIERQHQFWLARLDGQPVAWGWSALAELSIGELGIDHLLPRGNRYLWDFFTSPEARGRGIYPRLLQEIVKADAAASRFWLGHDMDNLASRRGISKAGFLEVGLVFRDLDGRFTMLPSGPGSVVAAAVELFAIPTLESMSDIDPEARPDA